MDQIADNGSPQPADTTNTGPIFTPPADIIEKGNTVAIVLDVPGAGTESLDVTLENRVVTISARVAASAPEGYAPAHVEFGEGTYERRFVFSEQLDGDHIDATLTDGVLRLTVPKAIDTAAKRITVKPA